MPLENKASNDTECFVSPAWHDLACHVHAVGVVVHEGSAPSTDCIHDWAAVRPCPGHC